MKKTSKKYILDDAYRFKDRDYKIDYNSYLNYISLNKKRIIIKDYPLTDEEHLEAYMRIDVETYELHNK